MTTSLLLVTLAALFVLGISQLLSPQSATAAYFVMMFLLSPARRESLKTRLLAGAWAVVVAMAGWTAGTMGLPAIAVGILVVCLIQALYRFGGNSPVTRTPVNFVAFALLAGMHVNFDQITIGSALGAAFILGASMLLASVNRRRAEKPDSATSATTWTAGPGSESAGTELSGLENTTIENSAAGVLKRRLAEGLVTGMGALAIVLISGWLDFDYLSWTLLSFCMIIAVDAPERGQRARDRLIGTLAGVLAATVVVLLPVPWPFLFAVCCLVLCVAYQLMGNYTMFVTTLTPVILLLASSEASTLSRGIGRIEAVLAAAAVALVCTWLHTRTMSLLKKTSTVPSPGPSERSPAKETHD